MALNRWPLPSVTDHFWGWRGIAWDFTRTPHFRSILQTSDDEREGVISTRSRSIDEFKFQWWGRDDMSKAAGSTRVFPANEARLLMSFFRQQRGRGIPFVYMDPTDKTTKDDEVLSASTPNIGADPTNPDSRNYQLVRTLALVTEPVDYMNTGLDGEASPVVKVNGGTVTFVANSPKDGWIRLDSAPTGGSVLSWTGSYYQRVRFREDAQDFHTFAYNFWELKQIILKTARW